MLTFDVDINPSVPQYRNETLEKIISDNETNSKVHLKGQKLTDQDMEIVANNLLRKSTVRKLCLVQSLS